MPATLPVWKANGTAVSGTGAITVNAPSGHAIGDFLVLAVNTSNEVLSTPSGWNAFPGANGAGTGTAASNDSCALYLFWKFAATTSESASVADSGNHTLGVITSFTGVSTNTPIETIQFSQKDTNSTSDTFPAITTVGENRLVVAAISTGQESVKSSPTFAGLGSFTARSVGITTSGVDGGIAVFSGTKATAGSTGTGSVTESITSKAISATFALRPVNFGQTPTPTGIASAGAMGAPTVNGGAIIITPTGDVTGYTSRSMSRQYSAAGGNHSFTWSVTSGGSALTAAGMTFSSGGLLSWTTATEGSYPVTIRATDTVSGLYAEISFTINVSLLKLFARVPYFGNGTTTVSLTDTAVDLSAGGIVWLVPRQNNDDTTGIAIMSHNGTTIYDYSGARQYHDTGTVAVASANLSVPGSLTLTLGNALNGNRGGYYYEAWLFAKEANVLDIVQFTGNNGTDRTLSHGLGVVPVFAMMGTANWAFYPTGDMTRDYSANGVFTNGATIHGWGRFVATSTQFKVSGTTSVAHDCSNNVNGQQYMAAFFADTSTTPSSPYEVTSYTGTNSASALAVSLGWKPQALIIQPDINGTNAYPARFDDSNPLGFVGRESYANFPNAFYEQSGSEAAEEVLQATATGFEVITASNPANNSTDLRQVFAIKADAETPAWQLLPRLYETRQGSGQGNSTVAVNWPPAHALGQVGLLAVASQPGTTVTLSGTGAADWTYLHHVEAAGGTRLTMFYSEVDTSPMASFFVEVTGGSNTVAQILVLDQVDVAQVAAVAAGISAGSFAGYYNSASNSSATTSVTLPGVTTVDDDVLVIGLVSSGVAATMSSWNHSNMPLWHRNSISQVARTLSFAVGHHPTPGATGGGTGTQSASGTYASATLVFRKTPETSAQTVSPTGVASAGAIGSPTVLRGAVTRQVTGIASAEALGAPTVLRGAVTAQATGIASASAFGSPTVQRGAVTVQPPGIATGEGVGAPVVSGAGGTQFIATSGVGTAQAFGSPTITTSATRAVTGIASGQAIGSPTVLRGARAVPLQGIGSAAAFGSPVVTTAAVRVVAGIATGFAAGTPTVLRGSVVLVPAGIGSAQALGVPLVQRGALSVVLASIGSSAAFGAPTLQASSTVQAGSIPSAEAFGVMQAQATAVIAPAGIASAEVFGTPSFDGAALLQLAGIPSGAAFGVVTVAQQHFIAPDGVASAESLGAPTIQRGASTVALDGIPDSSGIGLPAVTSNRAVAVDAIAPAEAVGLVALIPGQVYLAVAGIGSAEAFGVLYAGGGSRLPPPLAATRPRSTHEAQRTELQAEGLRPRTTPTAERLRTTLQADRPREQHE